MFNQRLSGKIAILAMVVAPFCLTHCKSSDEEPRSDQNSEANATLLLFNIAQVNHLGGLVYSGRRSISACNDYLSLVYCLLIEDSESEISARAENSTTLQFQQSGNVITGRLWTLNAHMDGRAYNFHGDFSATSSDLPGQNTILSITLNQVMNADEDASIHMEVQELQLEMNQDQLTGSMKALLTRASDSYSATIIENMNYYKVY